ncbi:helix-turn-helix domain-containing protein [Xanthomonas citri]|uniref:helix-turn-helix domain-containing protein n=1 Tax=Xanthomonas citri TaxID=346 RepID=UPI0005294A4E|nr:helix-turn-helix transcriptional regulator [Xanthomonas citri]
MPPKSIHRSEYQTLLELLVEIRNKAGLKQAELAEELGRPQSYVSAVERGGRRLDLLQLYEYCRACDHDLVSFVRRFEKAMSGDLNIKRRASRLPK